MKYLKKIMAVALAAGMVFSGSVVDGRASSYRVNNYFDEAANTTIDELFFYMDTLVDQLLINIRQQIHMVLLPVKTDRGLML